MVNKKFTSLILITIFGLLILGCSDKKDNPNSNENKSSSKQKKPLTTSDW